MTMYEPLEHHLRDLERRTTSLTFVEIERIIGARLPPSSHKYEAHWRGTSAGRPGGAIAAAGWRVERIDWLNSTIYLQRAHGNARSSGVRTAPANGSSRLVEVELPTEVDPSEVAAVAEVAAGDSAEQRDAERIQLDALSRALGTSLHKKAFHDASGGRVEVDGYSEAPPVLVEAWAHQGPPKSAQKFKVLTDAFKLVWIERAHLQGRPARKILLLSDERAAAHFKGRSWMASAIRDFGVEVMVQPLPEGVRQKVEDAQRRQFR